MHVLQLLLFGPEFDVVLPFDDDELEELLLSACAAKAVVAARYKRATMKIPEHPDRKRALAGQTEGTSSSGR